MTVGIIVLNLNQRDLVMQFVKELEKQSYKDFKLYLVDNGSDSSQRIQKEDIRRDWFHPIYLDENTGFAAGNNRGMEQAVNDGCRYLWVVNNDIQLAPDCMSNLLTYMEAHPQVGILGPKIYYSSEPKRIWYAGGKINWQLPFAYTVCTHIGERVMDEGQFDKETETDFVTGASMFVRREVFEKTHGFDEKYFAYFEDADWSLRTKESGFSIAYNPKAVMWHMVGSLSGVTSPRSSYFQIRNSLLFVHMWGPFSAKVLTNFDLFFILFKNLVKFFIPSRRDFANAQLRGVKDYLTGHFYGPF